MIKITRIVAATAAVALFSFAGSAEEARKTKPVKADGCSAGRITCIAWCGKYRTPQQQGDCLFNQPLSCMKKYGKLLYCVNDKPN